MTLPASWYWDPDVYERERHTVFARTWQHVGHASQVEHPGHYIAEDFAGWRVFVLRGADAVLRGFHNVCRHRAGPLVWDTAGTVGNLVCRYHGWAYRQDGSLLSARDFGDETDLAAAGFDPACMGLVPVRVETWRGLVFVNLDFDAAPLGEWLAGLDEMAAEFPIEDWAYVGRGTTFLRANWKNYCDNYSEGYHLPLVHPRLTQAVDAKNYRAVAHDDGRWAEHFAAPREGTATGKWLWLFPNLGLNIYPDGMSVERFVPRSPTTTELVFDRIFDPAGDPERIKATAEFSREITQEDVDVCEAVQANLEAGIYGEGFLSPRHEGVVASFQARLRRMVEHADAP